MSIWRCMFLITFFWTHSVTAEDSAHVAVGQIVEHQALDKIRNGLKEGLAQKGFVEGVNIIWSYDNAQGNPTIAVQIGHKLASENPKVIVALSTPMTQAIVSATSSIPVVFAAVTDPETAKLTSHQNVTGLTDLVPSEKQIDLVKKFVPNVKTIGVIYNSGEANSQKQVEALKNLCAKENITIIETTASKSSEVAAATKTLVGKVDAILLPTDNTVITALDSIVKIADHNNIPIFGSDVDIVEKGALAAYGVDWNKSGFELANIVSKILNGVPVKDIPIQNPNQLLFYINKTTADKLGIEIRDETLNEADLVI